MDINLDTITTAANGVKIPLRDWIARYVNPEWNVYIGTDSQQSVGVTKFTTAVAVHEPGHGGTYSIVRYKMRRISALHERLQTETWQSLQLGLILIPVIPDTVITIHIDVNPDLRYKSAIFGPELVGMVRAQGLAAEVKPKAFTASNLADAFVKCY